MEEEDLICAEDTFEQKLFHQMFHLVCSVDKLSNHAFNLFEKCNELENEIYELQKEIKKHWDEEKF